MSELAGKETTVKIENHPCSSEEADGPKSEGFNTLPLQHAEWDVTRPDIDFLSPSQYNEQPEMTPPRDFPHNAQIEACDYKSEARVIYKHLSIDPSHPNASDTESDLLRESGKEASTQSRSSHNRNVGYTLHTSAIFDYSVRKVQAAKKAAEFELLLGQESL